MSHTSPLTIGKLAAKKFLDDKVPRLGAALAYYTMFALAPLVIVAVAVAGLVISEASLQGEVVEQLDQTVGPDAAVFIQDMVARSQESGAGWGVVFGFALALVGASALIIQLKGALNVVWDVPVQATKGLTNALRARGSALLFLLGIGALLIAVQFGNTWVSGLNNVLSGDLRFLEPLLQVLTPLITLGLTAGVFAAMFRFLPDTTVGWREAGAGGLVAAVTYTIGSWALGFYIGNGGVGSTFGASATLVVLLVFIYYSAQIVLYGAEFARVYGLERSAASSSAGIAGPTTPVRPDPERAERTTLPAFGAFLAGLVIGWWRRRD
jgi:membrane protein